MLVKDLAICLARRDYSESSQIITVFARENGKVRGIAKGARRPKSKFGGGIELLSTGQLVFSTPRASSGLLNLAEWTVLNNHQNLRRSLGQLHQAYYLAELTDLFTEELDPHQQLYDMLSRALDSLCSGHNWLDLLSFQVGLLRQVGLWPDLSQCTQCGKVAPPRSAAYLSYTEGGLLCRKCSPSVDEKTRVTSQGLQIIRSLLTQPASLDLPGPPATHARELIDAQTPPATEILPPTAVRQTQQLLAYWIRSALNRQPKTAHLLR